MKYGRKCVLLGLLALLVLTVGAAACEGADCLRRWEAACIGEEPAEEVLLLEGADVAGAEAAAVKGMQELQAQIDIRQYQIPEADFEAFVQHLRSNNPELFMAQKYGYYRSGGIITKIVPQYTMMPEEYEAARAVYDAGVAAILAEVDPAWSDVEQLLHIHDYIAAHFAYDLRAYDPEQFMNVNFDAYSFFRDGTGVCQAYTMAFMAAARELGFEVSYVESREMNHAWNLVKVDGSWYHVDVTHDDPLAGNPRRDRLGYARHTHFLMSDQQSAIAHEDDASDWFYGNGQHGTDTTYDSYFWTDAISPFRYADGTWYAVTSGGLKTWDGTSVSFGAAVDSGFGVHAAGLDLYCGRLYYNTSRSVRCYEPFTGRSWTVTELGSPSGEGLRIEGNTLIYQYCVGDECSVGSVALDSYIAMEGGWGYYESGGTLYLNAPTACVAAARYDGDGRMTEVSLLTGTDTLALQPGQVKLMALAAGSRLPCCEALVGTVRTAGRS